MNMAEETVKAKTDPFDEEAAMMWEEAWAELNPSYDPEDPMQWEERQAAWRQATGLPDVSGCATAEEIQETLTEYFTGRTDGLGMYARVRRDYLRHYDPDQYWERLQDMAGFYRYLETVEEESREKASLLTDQIAEADEEITEQLKNSDMMRWVGLRNHAAASARETVIHQLSQ
jgi:hypothetical protein